ncbi:MAG: ABC transporter ATP-binding protein, partial [Actinomycetia bacterium]|nr:ABC transporter ATP-binding protein [Actinomycetes bacterium]
MFSKPLTRLLRRGLRPYVGQLATVVLLQLFAALASLELPTLNAQIIDNGVAKGDTGYIWSHGALMLAVSLVQVLAQVSAVF